MKRGISAVFICLAMCLIISPNFVSAWSLSEFDFRDKMNEAVGMLKGVLSPFFAVVLGVDEFSPELFAASLLLILMYVFVFFVLRRMELFKYNAGACFIISLIVAILSTRFMAQEGLISVVLMNYGILGVSISTLLPLILFFFFVHETIPHTSGRRFAWVLFVAIYIGLWATRWDKMVEHHWLFYCVMGATFVCFWLDKEIHSYFKLNEIWKWQEKRNNREIASLQAEYQKYDKVNSKEARDAKEDILRELKRRGAKSSGPSMN